MVAVAAGGVRCRNAGAVAAGAVALLRVDAGAVAAGGCRDEWMRCHK
jgi:hypothetical protein